MNRIASWFALGFIVAYVIWVVIPSVKKHIASASVKPGQVWQYKSTLPFHEHDAPQFHTVLEVRDGWVKYNMDDINIASSCSLRAFVIGSTIVSNTP